MSNVKIIKHLPSRIDNPDDPSLPFRLTVNLRPPEFMQVTFIMMHGGSEEVVARGPSRESLEQWAAEHGLTDHPRLRSLKIVEVR